LTGLGGLPEGHRVKPRDRGERGRERAAPPWLVGLCGSRLLLSVVFNAYAGVMPLLREEWGMSAARAATVQSAWHIGYLTSLFVVGMLADRYGARRTYLASSVFATVAAGAFALGSHGPTSALVLYGLAGLCSGGSYTPGLALIFQHTEPDARGRAMGWFLAASSLGYAAALAVVALLATLASWRAALVGAAVSVALGAGLGWASLRRLGDVAAGGGAPSGPWRAITATLRDKAAMACNWAYTFHCWELLAIWAWLPSFLAAAAKGGNSRGVGVAGLVHVVGAAGSIVGGTASDRWGRARVMLVLTLLSLTGSFLFGWLSAWPLWLLVPAGAVYNLCAIADSSVYSTALAEAVPASRLGTAYSVRSVMGFAAGAISPVVFGAGLDLARIALGATSPCAWAIAWSSAGLGAVMGPVMIARFARLSGRRAADGS
jgi:MFS family permease